MAIWAPKLPFDFIGPSVDKAQPKEQGNLIKVHQFEPVIKG